MQHVKYLLPALALTALLGVGCDDEDDADSPTAPREPTATATATPTSSPTEAPRPTADPTSPDPGAGSTTSFIGRVRSVDMTANPPFIEAGDRRVLIRPGTTLTRFGAPAALGDFEVGRDIIRAVGVITPDGDLDATSVSLEGQGAIE